MGHLFWLSDAAWAAIGPHLPRNQPGARRVDDRRVVSDIGAASETLAAAGRMKRLLADQGYDANPLRKRLREDGVTPVIPGRRNRKRPIRHDEKRHKQRWRIEAAFCRLKDFRRVATRDDRLTANFLSAVALAAFRVRSSPKPSKASSRRRLWQFLEVFAIPLVRLHDSWVFAILVNPAIDRPFHAGGILVHGRRPVHPVGNTEQNVAARERTADLVIFQEAVFLQNEQITGGIRGFIDAILLRWIPGTVELHASAVRLGANFLPDIALHPTDGIGNRAALLMRGIRLADFFHLGSDFLHLRWADHHRCLHLAAIGMTDRHGVAARRFGFKLAVMLFRWSFALKGAGWKGEDSGNESRKKNCAEHSVDHPKNSVTAL